MPEMPIGDLCILKGARGTSWSVGICQAGIRECLRSFDEFLKAYEFAISERNRRWAQGSELTIHCPDDCPCYCSLPRGGLMSGPF
jgi:hypothetical protein